jgi:hypothetical protein
MFADILRARARGVVRSVGWVAGNHALNGDGGRAFTRPHFFETSNAHARESRFGQIRTVKLRNSARICSSPILSECR